jgi:hypothetical protein
LSVFGLFCLIFQLSGAFWFDVNASTIIATVDFTSTFRQGPCHPSQSLRYPGKGTIVDLVWDQWDGETDRFDCTPPVSDEPCSGAGH